MDIKDLSRRAGRGVVLASLGIALIGQPLVSEAKLGGSSRSSAYGAPSSSIGSASSSRLGGGGSMGMSRPDVMAKARGGAADGFDAGRSGASAPAPSAPAAATARSGPGWGTVAGAAAAGAAAGYLLGNHGAAPANAPAYGGNGGGVAAGGNGYGVLPQQAPASGFGFTSLLVLLMMAGTAYWALRRYQAARRGELARVGTFDAAAQPLERRQEPSIGATHALPSAEAATERMALQRFNELQDANNRGDLALLRSRVEEPLLGQIEADIAQRAGPGRTSAVSIQARVIDATDEGARRLVSVRYSGLIAEGSEAPPEPLDEVWHFIDDRQGHWRLAGIEQV
ncbi:MAG: hypothetical protein JSR42_03060 [Proteobacteria bacterium]|nr:hypothetical protein [Pseudomonadota bacterium]